MATREGLAALGAPVLLVAGEVDWAACPVVVAEVAGLFGDAAFAVVAGAGHYPLADDPAGFVAVVEGFLGG